MVTYKRRNFLATSKNTFASFSKNVKTIAFFAFPPTHYIIKPQSVLDAVA